MSGITSGVGLFSGINSKQLIDQLIQLESRPKQLAQQRLLQLQQQQAAFLDLNSNLLGLKTAASAFNALSVFKAAKATSSNPSVVTASAGTSATPGAYQITVDRLVTADQQISRGFANRDITAIGVTEFSFEIGGGRLDSETTLAELNGGQGIDRGKVKITDSTGDSAVVDLSRAVTVNDVLEAINTASGVNVRASVSSSGDRLQVQDQAGGAGVFRIENVFGSETASSLGILNISGVAAGGTIASSTALLGLSSTTPLSALRDGAGVNFGPGGVAAVADFQIKLTDADTPANTKSFNIVLGEVGTGTGSGYTVTHPPVATIGDLIARINEQTEGAVAASISADGRSIVLTDTTGDAARTLTVTDSARRVAADLGLTTGTTAGAQGAQTLTSRRLLAGINSTLSSSLNGASGVSAGTFDVTRRNGTTFSVSIGQDFTVSDIIGAINSAGGGTVTAELNDSGNGIRIKDSTTGGNLIIADTSGTAAAGLKIATAGDSDGVIDSGSLQTRYVSNATPLSKLNGGKGVGSGEIRITDSRGRTARIRVNTGVKTVHDLVAAINARTEISVTARVNDNGDGILISDGASGTQKLKVEDVSGFVAKRLNLVGESASAATGENKINGSFERTIQFSASDTLDKVVNKINAAGIGLDATIVNNGSSVNPFRIVFTSETSGRVGRITVDTKGFDLGISTLTKGQDAVAFFGASDPAQAVLLTSSTNTLGDVVAGVTIDLLGTSRDPVELTVARDTAKVEKAFTDFVDAFNKVMDRLDFHERYDVETKEKGSLLGESATSTMRASLLSTVQGESIGVESDFTRLFQIGLSIGDGARLKFDPERFRRALEEDPQGVQDLVASFESSSSTTRTVLADAQGNPVITTPERSQSYSKLGVMERIKLLTTGYTSTIDGSISNRKKGLDTLIELQNKRILDFDVRLASKRGRLERQFAGLEQSLAALQGQQNALALISSQLG